MVRESLVSCFTDVKQFGNFVLDSSSRRLRDRVLLNSTLEDAAISLREASCASNTLDDLVVDLAEAHQERQDLWHLAWEVVSVYSEETPGKRDDLLERLRKMTPHSADASLDGTSSLEALTSADPFLNAVDLSDWSNLIKRQICQIRCGQEERGTGFLVGNDLVLTCFHVVGSHMVDGIGKGISVRFDFLSVQRSSAWMDIDPTWRIPCARPSKVDNFPDRNLEPQNDELDFAVLRLCSPEGETRGYVTVTDSESLPIVGSPVFIAGHPGPTAPQQPLRISLGAPGYDGVNGNRTRLLYKASTLRGSSGSPVFDHRFQPLALHHNRGESGIGNYARNNRGIPLYQICRSLKISSLDRLAHIRCKGIVTSEEPDATKRVSESKSTALEINHPRHSETNNTFSLLGQLPFVGRRRLRHCVDALSNNSFRVLLIDGVPKSGRTISSHYIQKVVQSSGERFRPLEVADPETNDTLSPVWLANDIALSFQWHQFPTRQTPDTVANSAKDLAIWITDSCQKEPAPCWLLFDNFEKASSDTREFIKLLIHHAISAANLRVVVLGDVTELTTIAPENSIIETIKYPTMSDTKAFLEGFASSINKPINEIVAQSTAYTLWSRLPHGNDLFLRVLSLELQVLMLQMRSEQ